MREIYRDIVGALIVSADGYILFGKKYPGKGGVYNDDCWHIPGGGLETGESHKDGIIREVREETLLDVSNEKITLLDDKGTGTSTKRLSSGEKVLCHMVFSVYQIGIVESYKNIILPKQTQEFSEFRWLPKDALLNYTLTPPSMELFQRLGWG